MENSIDTIIGVNVTLKGNLFNKGSIQVNGSVEGEVKSDENILIGESAVIKGPVIAKKIEISGEVKGLVEANDKLEIQPTGKVYGDVNAKTLIIREGAVFVGKSIMANTPPENAAEKKEKSLDEEAEKAEPEITVNEKVDKLGFFSKK